LVRLIASGAKAGAFSRKYPENLTNDIEPPGLQRMQAHRRQNHDIAGVGSAVCIAKPPSPSLSHVIRTAASGVLALISLCASREGSMHREQAGTTRLRAFSAKVDKGFTSENALTL
jgi:hypothetical protein